MTDLLAPETTEELEDFDSPELVEVEDADHGYLDSMWSGYSFRGSAHPNQVAADTIVAHGMVQSFVNAFARDGHYVVGFDPATQTAGTDMNAKRVTITPAPIADRALDAQAAGRVLTGLACHEICHPRYGSQTRQAVEKVFPRNAAASRLSNLLDDIRIERRFVADYPGYAGIFAPTLEYIGKAAGEVTPSLSEPINLAIAATRYPTFAKWTPATQVEADWWNDWAARGSREDSPKRRADFIREALAHVADVKAANPKSKPAQPAPSAPRDPEKPSQSSQPNPDTDDEQDGLARAGESGEQGDEEPTQSDSAGAGDVTDDEAEDEAPKDAGALTDAELNEATRGADADEPQKLPDCSGSKAIDKAAIDGGDTNRIEIYQLKKQADQIVENARNIESDGHGNTVDVARSLRGIASGRGKLPPSQAASRYIRNAILRARVGHTNTSSHQKRGRLDQKGLARIGHGDARVFEKRTAPSPDRMLVWVMVDCSQSMSGWGDYTGPIDEAAAVAHAIADASVGTPTVRMAVWGWSYPFRSAAAYAGVAKVWETGQDASDIFRIAGLRQGGTPDATVLGWAARAILREARPEERPVLIVVSDGAGDAKMNERVAEAREMGVTVKSVSFGAGFTLEQQEARFGRGNCVPFAGSVTATARPLAELFARLASKR